MWQLLDFLYSIVHCFSFLIFPSSSYYPPSLWYCLCRLVDDDSTIKDGRHQLWETFSPWFRPEGELLSSFRSLNAFYKFLLKRSCTLRRQHTLLFLRRVAFNKFAFVFFHHFLHAVITISSLTIVREKWRTKSTKSHLQFFGNNYHFICM